MFAGSLFPVYGPLLRRSSTLCISAMPSERWFVYCTYVVHKKCISSFFILDLEKRVRTLWLTAAHVYADRSTRSSHTQKVTARKFKGGISHTPNPTRILLMHELFAESCLSIWSRAHLLFTLRIFFLPVWQRVGKKRKVLIDIHPLILRFWPHLKFKKWNEDALVIIK